VTVPDTTPHEPPTAAPPADPRQTVAAVEPADVARPGDEGLPTPPAEQKLNGPLHFGMGATIGIGAGIGIALGSVIGNLAAGLAVGAGLGVVAGAVLESRGRR